MTSNWWPRLVTGLLDWHVSQSIFSKNTAGVQISRHKTTFTCQRLQKNGKGQLEGWVTRYKKISSLTSEQCSITGKVPLLPYLVWGQTFHVSWSNQVIQIFTEIGDVCVHSHLTKINTLRINLSAFKANSVAVWAAALKRKKLLVTNLNHDQRNNRHKGDEAANSRDLILNHELQKKLQGSHCC